MDNWALHKLGEILSRYMQNCVWKVGKSRENSAELDIFLELDGELDKWFVGFGEIGK